MQCGNFPKQQQPFEILIHFCCLTLVLIYLLMVDFGNKQRCMRPGEKLIAVKLYQYRTFSAQKSCIFLCISYPPGLVGYYFNTPM